MYFFFFVLTGIVVEGGAIEADAAGVRAEDTVVADAFVAGFATAGTTRSSVETPVGVAGGWTKGLSLAVVALCTTAAS